jgi:hypothetical protein
VGAEVAARLVKTLERRGRVLTHRLCGAEVSGEPLEERQMASAKIQKEFEREDFYAIAANILDNQFYNLLVAGGVSTALSQQSAETTAYAISSTAHGVSAVPRFLIRPAGDNRARFVGTG